MKHIDKPKINIKDMLTEMSESIRDSRRKGAVKKSVDFFVQKSQEYDELATINKLYKIPLSKTVNENLSSEDMIWLYNQKFVLGNIKAEYYDKIMSLAVNGKCPICGIGPVSNLDHYLAKSLYPTYAITPINLVPECRDCNFNKRDTLIKSATDSPLHPYYDEIDNRIWLVAELVKDNDNIIVRYAINSELYNDDIILYKRLENHFILYKLNKAYSVQATTEICENMQLWHNIFSKKGQEGLKSYLKECLESKELLQKNTWNTALLRALIDNIEIIE